jgi:hypothetical protein
MFLNDKPSLPVLLVLLPIIGGVVLASTSELSFTWKGFLSGASGSTESVLLGCRSVVGRIGLCLQPGLLRPPSLLVLAL